MLNSSYLKIFIHFSPLPYYLTYELTRMSVLICFIFALQILKNYLNACNLVSNKINLKEVYKFAHDILPGSWFCDI